MKKNNIEKVSIIMPSNNILSPLTEISYKFSIQQDYKNLEFLIYLNGMNLINKEEIIIYLNKHNIYKHDIIILYSNLEVSPGKARSELIKASHGDLLVFIDSDDIPETNLISSKMELANDKDLDIICCSANIFSNLRQYEIGSMKLRTYSIPLSFLDLFGNSFVPLAVNLIPNSGTMIRRKIKNKDVLQNYPNGRHEDFIFYLRLLKNTQYIALIEKPLIAYYVNKGTLTGNKLLSKIWHAKAISKARNIPLINSLLLTFFGIFILMPVIFVFEKIRLFLKNKSGQNKISFKHINK